MKESVGMHPGASETQSQSDTSQAGWDTRPAGLSDAPGCIPTGNKTICLPERKNIRAEFHNYSGGDYFITICTRNKEHYFGEIYNGVMKFSLIGKYTNEAMRNLASHYSYVEVPLYVVMPNHVHAIISIHENPDAPGCIPTIRTALGVVIGGFKQSVTRFARRNDLEFGWQSRFHDHIIRGTRDGNMIAEYILNNVALWASDCYHDT